MIDTGALSYRQYWFLRRSLATACMIDDHIGHLEISSAVKPQVILLVSAGSAGTVRKIHHIDLIGRHTADMRGDIQTPVRATGNLVKILRTCGNQYRL